MKWQFFDRRINDDTKRLPSNFYIKCGICGEIIKVTTWSFAGCGKKCPACGKVHYLSELWRKPLYGGK